MPPMLPVAFAALVFGQVTSWASGRPPECVDARGKSGNVWERARSPELARYCDLLANASSKLAGTTAMAQSALASAREAETVVPGHAAPRMLEGRALEALGKLEEARQALSDARMRDPAALDDPRALLAWARVLARTGRTSDAVIAYRSLLPRATSLAMADRVSAAVEAGLVSMSQGSSGLDEAVAALREGARAAQDETQAVATLALALALDRRGDTAELHGMFADRVRSDPRTAIESTRGKEILEVAPAEASAMVGLALEASDPGGARDAWEQYVTAGHSGPWVAHAKAHLAALPGKRGAR